MWFQFCKCCCTFNIFAAPSPTEYYSTTVQNLPQRTGLPL